MEIYLLAESRDGKVQIFEVNFAPKDGVLSGAVVMKTPNGTSIKQENTIVIQNGKSFWGKESRTVFPCRDSADSFY